jgi:hypothetical protein
VQFSLQPLPALEYWTQSDWTVAQTKTSGQPTGGTGGEDNISGGGADSQAGVLPFGGSVRTGVPPHPHMKGDDLYKLSLTVPADWPMGPNGNSISIGEYGESGGTNARNVKLKDGTGTVMYECVSDTYPSIPYCVGGPPQHGAIVLLPGGVYYIEIFNNGPKPEGATYPPITDMVIHCYAPQK